MVFLKHFHATCAILSLCGFFLRGLWLLRGSALFNAKLTRIIPHLIDSCLLGSALGLLWLYQWNPFDQTWLTIKIIALLAYIALGLLAFRFAKNRRQQLSAWMAALCCGTYILALAITKSAFLNLL